MKKLDFFQYTGVKGGFNLEELPYVIIISIVLIGSWIDYRKKINKAENSEEIRKALVPFLLIVFLFVVSISVFLT
ncbi:hypothetical protein LAV73_03235 [Lysinibacillus xylanilyticus]|uniref:hypothetical protein n=1 Tax=Lysinibacillus xylanilyticus TaxID=582475 RepID=UPI002B24BCB9|nr:hypothetical protein [Lysinibacillus xylanilyticus]MEB2279015.1 hypothetical protein [Lysinibacillus xylanilyticus]